MIRGVPTFVKWAGGKKQLLKQFEPLLPKKIDKYIEPFVGGGAVFFFIQENFTPKEIILCDYNKDLINLYKQIKSNVEKLIKELKKHRAKHNKEYYYQIRKKFNKEKDPIKKAGYLLYLNKTCFNGLYRVNSNNEFNVPMGGYKNPSIFDEEKLRKVSKILKKVRLISGDFEKILKFVDKKSFVYFDPPYYTENNGFTTYTKNNFDKEDQKRLAEFCKKLDKKGTKFMLSNSDTKFIKRLYKGFKKKTVSAKRMINCNAKGRGPVKEVVFRNY